LSKMQTYETHVEFGEHAAMFHDFLLENPNVAVEEKEQASSLEQDMGMYRYHIQPWPMLAGGNGLREFRTAVGSICNLLKTIPARIFSNNTEALREFYGFLEEAPYMSLQSNPTFLADMLCRMDLIYTTHGFKAIEANFSAYLGGWQTALREPKIRKSEPMASFFSRHPFHYQNPSPLQEALAHIIATTSPLSSNHELNLFFAFPFPIHAEISRFLNHFYQNLLAKRHPSWAGHISFGSMTDLTVKDRHVSTGSSHIHALVVFFETALPPFLLQAHSEQQVLIFNPPSAQFLRDKRNFALLSQHQDSSLFHKEEQDVIKAFVPWTRLLKPGTTHFREELLRIPEDILRMPEVFLLKKGQSSKGKGVYLGSQSDLASWKGIVYQCLESGGFIVQERLDSAPFLFFDQTKAVPHNAVWGGFCFGESYGGGQLRVTPCDGKDRIINADRGANVAPLWEL